MCLRDTLIISLFSSSSSSLSVVISIQSSRYTYNLSKRLLFCIILNISGSDPSHQYYIILLIISISNIKKLYESGPVLSQSSYENFSISFTMAVPVFVVTPMEQGAMFVRIIIKLEYCFPKSFGPVKITLLNTWTRRSQEFPRKPLK